MISNLISRALHGVDEAKAALETSRELLHKALHEPREPDENQVQIQKVAEAYEQARVWGATIAHLEDGLVMIQTRCGKAGICDTLPEVVAGMARRLQADAGGECVMVVGMDPAKPGGDRNGCAWKGLPQFPGLWNIPLDADMVDRLRRGTNGQGGRQDFHRALVHRLSPDGVLSIDEKLCKTLFAYCEGDFGHAEHLIPLADLVREAQTACPPDSLFEKEGP